MKNYIVSTKYYLLALKILLRAHWILFCAHEILFYANVLGLLNFVTQNIIPWAQNTVLSYLNARPGHRIVGQLKERQLQTFHGKAVTTMDA